MPPEKSAYALARYSRSPDSIRDSIDWVRRHDSQNSWRVSISSMATLPSPTWATR